MIYQVIDKSMDISAQGTSDSDQGDEGSPVSLDDSVEDDCHEWQVSCWTTFNSFNIFQMSKQSPKRHYTHWTRLDPGEHSRAKFAKFQSPEYLSKGFSMICCHHYCLDNFSIGTAKQLLIHWSSLDTKAATTQLADCLQNSKVADKSDRTTVIDGQFFNLRLNGHPVCLNAFKWLTISSHTKLLHILKPQYHEATPLGSCQPHKETKEQQLKALLDVVFQYNKKPFTWWNGYEQLEGFSSKKEVYQMILQLQQDEQFPIAPGQDLFNKVWHKYFPTIVCRNEDPECPQCAQLKVQIHNYKLHNDPNLALVQSQLDEHIAFKNAEHDYDRETTSKALYQP